MLDDYASLFAYNRWADDRIVRSCRALSPEQYTRELEGGFPSIRATLVHLAGASLAWARRIEGETITALPAEAEAPTLDDAARLFGEAHDAFDRLAPSLTPERLSAIWTYRNLKGRETSVPFWAVLRHVVNHGSHHRGQVASKLRRLGVDPEPTDLVLWAIEATPQVGQG
jgi:uncharacterized damage-inducible protein DinB